jgi:transposase
MYLRSHTKTKNGKTHCYWSIAESKRIAAGSVVQKTVLYLGEINDSQQEAWRKTIEVFEDGATHPRTMALFPEDRCELMDDESVVQIRLKDLELRRPRQWGGCWLATHLYEQLGLDEFWRQRLEPNRKGTRWDKVLETLVCYRLLDPGSEWRLHRQWFEHSAMGDLLGGGFELAEIHRLYECLDLVLAHKGALFKHLRGRWEDLFNCRFDVLLYDLTSTYFESDPPFPQDDKRKFGHSRDKRSDCVQVVIALVVTPEGLPLSYEVMPGNTSDKTTLGMFLEKIEQQYGQAQRIWVMDRGIPTEEVLEQMRQSKPPTSYLVGTPKGRLSKLEAQLSQLSWQEVREGVEVKLLPQEGEVYVLAQSVHRVSKERAMRRRQLKQLWNRLKELKEMKISRDNLLLKLGAARQASPSAWRFIKMTLPKKAKNKPQGKRNLPPSGEQGFGFSLNTQKLREAFRREGRYLLRSNLKEEDPAKLWQFYIQLTQVEEAFKTLKGDLAIRPIFHQNMERIEAHIFIAFVAYCLHVTLGRRLKDLAPGLTSRAVLEKFSAIQMIDVHLPTTDGRKVILTRYTQPEEEVKMLLQQLKLELPDQPPPKITAKAVAGT